MSEPWEMLHIVMWILHFLIWKVGLYQYLPPRLTLEVNKTEDVLHKAPPVICDLLSVAWL